MEEEIIKEIVNDETMHCAACNITLYNESVWEVHKKGKKWNWSHKISCRHQKLLKQAVEERKLQKSSGKASANALSVTDNSAIGRIVVIHSFLESGPMQMKENDPIMAFISGMEDMKPQMSEKARKKQEKRRKKQQEQDEKNKLVIETQNREREEETKAINEQVASLNRRVKYVAADGNCMYHSIAQQLALEDSKMKSPIAYRVVRKLAADSLRKHKDEFAFFLDDGVDFEEYCRKVETSNGLNERDIWWVEWGGQLELRALSLSLQRPIHIYSADAPVIVMGEDMPVCICMCC